MDSTNRDVGFANVYNQQGKTIMVAVEINLNNGDLSRLLTKAYYHYGLVKPEYSVFQNRCLAVFDARITKN